MFHKWGFLLTEIWVLLILAALIGLLAGWIIWGRRSVVTDTREADGLRADLAACTARGRELAAKVATLEADLTATRAADAVAKVGAAVASAEAPAPLAAMAAPVVMAPVVAAPMLTAPILTVPMAAAVAAKPQGLTAARDGKADDLKLIKGIGPKLELLCHSLGFYHFDQIANWTAAEIAWVDDNLEGFKGRVTRDAWVTQARDLAAGMPPLAGGEG